MVYCHIVLAIHTCTYYCQHIISLFIKKQHQAQKNITDTARNQYSYILVLVFQSVQQM